MGSRLIDLTGKKFNRLTVIERDHTKTNRVYWWCECDCGKRKSVSASNIKRGCVQSCGCKNNDRAPRGSVNTKRHPLNRVWQGMISRCYSLQHPKYKRYGGRGIKVCDRWKVFENFCEDMGPRESINYTLDRKEVDGDYCPENCRWATFTTQNRNRSWCKYLTIYGQDKSLAEWAEIAGIHPSTINSRLGRGWPEKIAVFAPPGWRRPA